MKKRRLFVLLCLVLCIILVLPACKNGGDSAKDTITFVIGNDIMSLDPGQTSSDTDYIMYTGCVYEGLTALKSDGTIEPGLAESWTIEDGGLTYIFHLKQGVKFHNGEELKASDVVFSYNYAKESPFTASFGALFESVEAVDEYTVKVTLASPFAPFLSNVAGAMIHSEKAVNDGGDNYGLNPVGTGPFRFAGYELGQKVTFERFEDYHRGPAALKTIVYKIVADPNTALVSLEAGTVDYLFSVPEISYSSLKSNKELQVIEYDSRELTHLTMNINAEPFNSLEARRAVNCALDKEAVVKIALEGLGAPADYVLNKKYFGYSDQVTGYEYNPEKAKELLTAAGYPDGLNLKLTTCDRYSKTAQVVQEQLGQVGIHLEMEQTDQNAMMESVASGNYTISLFMWSLDSDADSWKYVFKTGDIVNYAPYSNPAVDDLFVQAQQTTDSDERVALYAQLFQIISDDAVMAPIFHAKIISAGSSDLNIGEFNTFGQPLPYFMNWK